MDVRPHVAVVRVAVEGLDGHVRGTAAERSDAAICRATVARELVADGDSRALAGGYRERRVEGRAVQADEAPEALRVLVDAVDSEGDPFAEGLAEVCGDAP